MTEIQAPQPEQRPQFWCAAMIDREGTPFYFSRIQKHRNVAEAARDAWAKDVGADRVAALPVFIGAPAIPAPEGVPTPTDEQIDEESMRFAAANFVGEALAFEAGAKWVRAALAAQPQAARAYRQANPLGGPAKVFRAMADAIEAGDSYEDTLRRFEYAEARPSPAEGDARAQFEAAYVKAFPVSCAITNKFDRDPEAPEEYDAAPVQIAWVMWQAAKSDVQPKGTEAEGDVVVTWDQDRTRILAVTRQDDEGRIISVIAKAPAPAATETVAWRWRPVGGNWCMPTHKRELAEKLAVDAGYEVQELVPKAAVIQASAPAHEAAEPAQGNSDDLVLVRRDLLGAACAAIRRKHDAPKTLDGLRAAAIGEAMLSELYGYVYELWVDDQAVGISLVFEKQVDLDVPFGQAGVHHGGKVREVALYTAASQAPAVGDAKP